MISVRRFQPNGKATRRNLVRCFEDSVDRFIYRVFPAEKIKIFTISVSPYCVLILTEHYLEVVAEMLKFRKSTAQTAGEVNDSPRYKKKGSRIRASLNVL